MSPAKRQRLTAPAGATLSPPKLRARTGITSYGSISKQSSRASLSTKKGQDGGKENSLLEVKMTKAVGTISKPSSRLKRGRTDEEETSLLDAKTTEAVGRTSKPNTRASPCLKRARTGGKENSSLGVEAAGTVNKISKPSLQAFFLSPKKGQTDGKPNTPLESKTTTPPTEAVASRKQALLDRIIAKQRLQASLPDAPSKEQLERRAALQRAESIMRVVGMLAATKATGQRVSFSLQMLVQSVQGSVRSPISADETVRCLEVLADELVPGYVRLVKTGSVVGVVIDQSCKTSSSELNARLSIALER